MIEMSDIDRCVFFFFAFYSTENHRFKRALQSLSQEQKGDLPEKWEKANLNSQFRNRVKLKDNLPQLP